MRSIKSSCDVIHDASNLLDVGPACVVELSVARFARTKTKQLTARGPGSTECTASLRKSAEPAYWPRRVPALGQRCTRAGERSAPGGQRDAEIWITRTAELVLHHLILKCPKTHEGAQLGLGRDMRHQARLAPAENRNQTNQMPHTNIKQSKSHEYHFPIPLVFRIKTIKIPGKSR